MSQYFNFEYPKSSFKVSKIKALVQSLVAVLIFAFIVDYVTLPAYNIHDQSFIFLLIVYLVLFAFLYLFQHHSFDWIFKLPVLLALILAISTFTLSFLGSEFLNASAYRDQIVIAQETDFTATFDSVQLDQIPLLDKTTAQQLGDKQMGKVQGLGSQYLINSDYTLISSLGTLYRVSPLEHQGFIKWFQNRQIGIPGYVSVNVTDPNDVKLVELNTGIKYSPSSYFDQDLLRHVRFSYRTEILQDFTFEIDDTGHPFYVISVVEPEIGWFTGFDTEAVIVVDAVSGDMAKFGLDELPTWVDRAQPTELAWAQIDNWGYYVHGYWNTMFGQKDMIQTSDGYNYVSIEGETYIFSGMTSVGADRSIVGFALINLRTKEATYLKIGGADETSAMSSAQGQVQDLGYSSTFPVLLNIQSVPTYFMSLKDDEGLIKMFAMVNVQDYSLVGVGESVEETLKNYTNLLLEKAVIIESENSTPRIQAIISDIRSVILDGTTTYYLRFENDDHIYIASAPLSIELAYSVNGDFVEVQIGDMLGSSIYLDVFDNLNLSY